MLPGWGYDRGSPATYGFGATLRSAISSLFRRAKTRIATAPPEHAIATTTQLATTTGHTTTATVAAHTPPDTTTAHTAGTDTDLQVRTKP